MSFMTGLAAIRHQPKTPPAHAATEAQEATRLARYDAILKALEGDVELTTRELAATLKSPIAMVRADVTALTLSGKLLSRFDGISKYVRRSIL